MRDRVALYGHSVKSYIMEKVLTIVVPTYNMERHLDKCLSSLVVSGGNMRRLEVLVVNDGSADRSGGIAHAFERRHPQTFRVIDKENGNYGSCVNRGLKEASGKYIKVLDADDCFDRDVFDKFVGFLSEVDADLVVSDFKVVSEKGRELRACAFPLPAGREFGLEAFSEDVIRWMWHHAITYRTENVRKMGYRQTEGIPYTDSEWIFTPMGMVRKVRRFPHFLYLYLRGREGQTFDPKVLRNAVGVRIVVTKKMISDYERIKDSCDKEGLRYLDVKLFEHIRGIYRHYLTEYSTEEGNGILAGFDTYIGKECPEVSVRLDGVRNKVGCRYIRNWRKSGYRRTTLMLIFLRKAKRMLTGYGGHSMT